MKFRKKPEFANIVPDCGKLARETLTKLRGGV